MAKDDWRERLERIGKREPDEASKRIMAGIEAAKKHNKELSDKRTRSAVESVLNQGAKEKKSESKSADNSPKKASRSAEKAPKSSKTSSSVGASRASSTSTTLRTQKGGSMTVETTTKESRRQADLQKETERILNSPREHNKQPSQNTSSRGNSSSRAEGDRPLLNSRLSLGIKNIFKRAKEHNARAEQRQKEYRERNKKKEEQ